MFKFEVFSNIVSVVYQKELKFCRFLIKNCRISFLICHKIYCQGKVIAEKWKFLCFLKFSEIHSCHLYDISA